MKKKKKKPVFDDLPPWQDIPPECANGFLMQCEDDGIKIIPLPLHPSADGTSAPEEPAPPSRDGGTDSLDLWLARSFDL